QMVKPVAEDFDEFSDDSVFSQGFGNIQHQVGGGGSHGQFPGELEPNDLRHDKINGLPQESGFGLDPADAPTDDANPVDHGGVAVGSDEGIGKYLPVAFGHPFGEVFQIHLVADSH